MVDFIRMRRSLMALFSALTKGRLVHLLEHQLNILRRGLLKDQIYGEVI